LLTDAFALSSFAHRMLATFADGGHIETPEGTIHFEAAAQHHQTLKSCSNGEVIWLSAEQSNSSLIVGDTVMLKVFRRVFGGQHPEPEMSRYLTEQGFAHAPPHLGEVVRIDDRGIRHSLAVAQGFVRNQGDAWTWTLDLLTRAVNELGADANAGSRDDIVEDCEDFAATVGKRLAEMHAVLARPTANPDFSPEMASQGDVATWAERTTALLMTALEIIKQQLPEEEGEIARQAAGLLARRDGLLAVVDRLAQAGVGTPMTRIHGDFHLGQVLVASGDAYIIDFEGEPARPLSERRAKASPLRDVAGLLRSFDYVAATMMDRNTGGMPQAPDPARTELLNCYRNNARDKFLAAYRAPAGGGRDAINADLLDLFLIEKAAYEIGYEAANRPAWIGVPLSGLAAIADDILSKRGAS
jgi:maltose alpha-D-glucosyltransferase/alpha-amylase